MENSIKNQILDIIYHQSEKDNISDADIKLLNAYPSNIIFPILQDIYFRESNTQLRGKVYNAMLSLKEVDIVHVLITLLDSPPIDMHTTYCYDLAEYDDPRSSQKLVQILLTGKDPNLRGVAAMLLARFSDPNTLQALEYASLYDKGIDFEDVPIADIARWALKSIQSKAS